ncbi:AzlD domain-containing protein [Aureimonas frigidaquae]|uniref:Branched-chain amino acid transport n=1 Tax=Aureimonas frigidaquae TaxID=424757 RepID=A0A0P0Z0P6_9HYPH|nr:AzlD domain-containing protein [Aureimonas frigidaquae]BAT27296.1 hypothetical protein [Aureimonas frigidaquae]
MDDTALAIAAMAAVTLATRFAGLAIPAALTQRPRLARAFAALPVAVLTAIVTPVALATGPAETAGVVLTVLAATRLPLIATVALGVACVAFLRGAGL